MSCLFWIEDCPEDDGLKDASLGPTQGEMATPESPRSNVERVTL